MMRIFGILCFTTAWLATAPFAFASANVDCVIDDKNVKFLLEGIAGRSGPINQVNGGSLKLKAGKGPEIPVTMEHLVQQWIIDDDFRLQIKIEAEDPNGSSYDLRIIARYDKRRDKYFGSYVLTMFGSGAEREFKGSIKSCLAG